MRRHLARCSGGQGFETFDAIAQGLLDMKLTKDNGRAAHPAIQHTHKLRQWCEEVRKPAVLAAEVRIEPELSVRPPTV